MLGTSASLSPPPGGPVFIPNAMTTGGVPQAPLTSSGPFNPNMAQGPTPPGSSASPFNMTLLNSSSSNAGFTGSMFTSLHSLAVPMPMPGTDNAPYFKGTRVEDFLDSLKNHADNAQLSHTYLPAYVPHYCSDKIHVDMPFGQEQIGWLHVPFLSSYMPQLIKICSSPVTSSKHGSRSMQIKVCSLIYKILTDTTAGLLHSQIS